MVNTVAKVNYLIAVILVFVSKTTLTLNCLRWAWLWLIAMVTLLIAQHWVRL